MGKKRAKPKFEPEITDVVEIDGVEVEVFGAEAEEAERIARGEEEKSAARQRVLDAEAAERRAQLKERQKEALTREAEERFLRIEGLGQADSMTLADDVNWVYRHLDDAKVNSLDAPRRSAWSLHRWAKKPENRDKFFSKLVPDAEKELSARRLAEAEAKRLSGELEESIEPDRLERRGDAKLRSMLVAAVKESRKIRVEGDRVVVPGFKE